MGSRNDKAFARSDALYGERAGEAFASARVAVCGAGAVGSFALEALARLGVGEFLVCDFDSVEESNINRQIVALRSTIGRKKAEVARERILDINPGAKVEIFSKFIDGANCADILKWRPDVLVDAIDSADSKCALLLSCCRAGIPAVSSMGAARRLNPEKIRTADLFDTRVCPLAARVRRELRKSGIERGIMCVFSEENPLPLWEDGIEKTKIMGSSPVVTGIFGLVLAGLAADRILKNFHS